MKPIDFRPADVKLDKVCIPSPPLCISTNPTPLQTSQQQTLIDEDKKSTWIEKEPHEGILMELCACDNCLKYRESVIHFYVEECEYNILWIRLQQIILRHYELISE